MRWIDTWGSLARLHLDSKVSVRTAKTARGGWRFPRRAENKGFRTQAERQDADPDPGLRTVGSSALLGSPRQVGVSWSTNLPHIMNSIEDDA